MLFSDSRVPPAQNVEASEWHPLIVFASQRVWVSCKAQASPPYPARHRKNSSPTAYHHSSICHNSCEAPSQQNRWPHYKAPSLLPPLAVHTLQRSHLSTLHPIKIHTPFASYVQVIKEG